MHALVITFVLATLTSLPAFAQDVAAGARSWNKCRACHQVGENARNGAGPQLNGLFGRMSGTADGYNYSAASKTAGFVWDDKTFAAFIENPRENMRGTKMIFAGIKNPQEISDLIAYLRQFGISDAP